MTAAVVIGASVAVLTLIFFTSVTVHIRLKRRGEDDRITVTVAWLKYLRYSVDMTLVDLALGLSPGIRLHAALGRPQSLAQDAAGEKRISLSALWRTYRRYRWFNRVLWFLAGRTRLRRLCWHSEIGLGEAHQTGLAVGLLWALKSGLITGLYALTTPLSPPELVVRPNYRGQQVSTFLDCVLQVRLADFVLAVLKAVGTR